MSNDYPLSREAQENALRQFAAKTSFPLTAAAQFRDLIVNINYLVFKTNINPLQQAVADTCQGVYPPPETVQHWLRRAERTHIYFDEKFLSALFNIRATLDPDPKERKFPKFNEWLSNFMDTVKQEVEAVKFLEEKPVPPETPSPQVRERNMEGNVRGQFGIGNVAAPRERRT